MNERLCRLCGDTQVSVIRESTVSRGSRQYLTQWYRCPVCLDISFGYQVTLSHSSSLTAPPLRPAVEEPALT